MNQWVIENLQKALTTWNETLTNIQDLLKMNPIVWNNRVWFWMETINLALQAIGLALLVLFFVVGMVKTCSSYTDVKKPEHALKLFVRFALAKGAITYGMDWMKKLMQIGQGIIEKIVATKPIDSFATFTLPEATVTAINDCGFISCIPLLAVSLIGSLLVTVLSMVMILTVYGRFFKIYMYMALAPVPLSTFAGEPTQNIGKSFVKSYCSVLLEGAIIAVAVIICSLIIKTPTVDTSATAATQVWSYLQDVVFNMLLLVMTVKASDRIVKEMMGL